MVCTRCDGTGFLNVHQIPVGVDGREAIEAWIAAQAPDSHDVCDCDCCDGSGEHGPHERTFDCM